VSTRSIYVLIDILECPEFVYNLKTDFVAGETI